MEIEWGTWISIFHMVVTNCTLILPPEWCQQNLNGEPELALLLLAVRWCEAIIWHQGGVSESWAESWGRIFYLLPSVKRLFFASFTGVLPVETNVFHPPHGTVWSAVSVGSAEAKKRAWKLSPVWQHQGSFHFCWGNASEGWGWMESLYFHPLPGGSEAVWCSIVLPILRQCQWE